MATFTCRVQFLDDTDPFNSTNFPEPTRPPLYTFRQDLPLVDQIAGVHKTLKAPHKLDDCTLQLSHSGTYLDLESTLAEQRDELEGFQEDGGRGKKHSIVLRTQLSVRVHACIEKLYNSSGRELRRALFSLKQIFQDDKDLVHEFVVAEGLACLIKVGAEADQNYQNYILRALGQIMLYVDGMNGVIGHNETIQWLYTLIGSKFRLVVKTALKLLLVFVEYTETNAALLVRAINVVDTKRGCKLWSNAMEILDEKDGTDTELLVYVMTLINKTLAGLPDQDSFYDVVDCLEEQGIEGLAQKHLSRKGTDFDLVEQFNIYEVTLRHEDGDDDSQPPPVGRKDRRRASLGSSNDKRGLERRRSRRHSLHSGRGHTSAPASPSTPHCRTQSGQFLPFAGQRVQDVTERVFFLISASCPVVGVHRPALGSLLASSYRQHQESLAAERERRRIEREERLLRIEREERARFKYRQVEKLAGEEYEKERSRTAPRGRSELTLNLSPPPSSSASSRCSTPSSANSHEPALSLGDSTSRTGSEPEPEAELPEPSAEPAGDEGLHERDVVRARETQVEVESGPEQAAEREAEDVATLSEKERQNEELNEKDNCSASSISSTSSTLEREEKEEKLTCENEPGEDVDVNEQCSKILNGKLFMLDMLYAQNKPPVEGEEKEGSEGSEGKETESQDLSVTSLASRISTLEASRQACEENVKKIDLEQLDNQGSVRAVAEKFGDLMKGMVSPPEADVPERQQLPSDRPIKKESDYIWDQLMASPRQLRIKDMDFTDLADEDDVDILDVDNVMGSGDPAPPPPPPPCLSSLPPPPPLFGCPPPPPVPGLMPPPPPFSAPLGRGEPPTFLKKKKTIRLFWNEVRPVEWPYRSHKRCKESLWSKLEPVKVDTSRLEHLFESKSKELPVTKKTAADGKRQEIIVLDSKRSNAINIGLTVLPPPRTIKTAILNFDEYALNKEGIEKILTMIPTEEEKQKIQEAQLANPDVPLGSAEQFLLTLSSISELSARLQLWAFKMDYEVMEKEVAEPLQDLKEGMDQLEKNKTLRYILSTLLAIGNFLNGSSAKGFELSYLEKVPEVKDTVHKQSLLHHACSIVVENFPDSSDLYSEIGAITRSAKVDFDQLQESLCQMEKKCKASWDHLKVITKHEMKPALKQKMSEFLKDCAERIIILKIVHRRIINRFHAFLLFLGHPPYTVREVSIHRFCKTVSEFALEYRTTRERVLQQRQKRASHRERNKTRGKMITDVSKYSSALQYDSSAQGLQSAEDAAEHEHMKAVLRTSLQGSDGGSSLVPGLRTRTRASRGRMGSWSAVNDESLVTTEDTADEIMERIVRSATQGPSHRTLPLERRRSRANRKSLRRTRKGGLTPEEAQALGLVSSSEMQV
uniref:Formin homology 2 domain containing 3 n=1 Tax=Scleropages formosus TaxID=113540 RepID=A0A8C9WIP4_SCLFO